jgi:hypothetical protein
MSRPLAIDECQELATILNLRHGAFLGDRKFSVECNAGENWLEVVITLARGDETYVYPLEGRICLRDCSQSPREAALVLVDYMGLYFDAFFEDQENTFVTIDWQPHDHEGTTLELRGQILDRCRERQADAILASVSSGADACSADF